MTAWLASAYPGMGVLSKPQEEELRVVSQAWEEEVVVVGPGRLLFLCEQLSDCKACLTRGETEAGMGERELAGKYSWPCAHTRAPTYTRLYSPPPNVFSVHSSFLVLQEIPI